MYVSNVIRLDDAETIGHDLDRHAAKERRGRPSVAESMKAQVGERRPFDQPAKRHVMTLG